MGKYQEKHEEVDAGRMKLSIDQLRDLDRLIQEKYMVKKFSKYHEREIDSFDREAYLLDKGAASFPGGIIHAVPHVYALENEKLDQWERYRDRREYAKKMEANEYQAMADQLGNEKRV